MLLSINWPRIPKKELCISGDFPHSKKETKSLCTEAAKTILQMAEFTEEGNFYLYATWFYPTHQNHIVATAGLRI